MSMETHTPNRRVAAATSTQWPLVTSAQLASLHATEASFRADEINQSIYTLIRARKAIGDARLALNIALRHNASNDAVCLQLRALNSTLGIALQQFPLTVK